MFQEVINELLPSATIEQSAVASLLALPIQPPIADFKYSDFNFLRNAIACLTSPLTMIRYTQS
jgi:hypothetical protein